jgi:putative restriction endonuclease
MTAFVCLAERSAFNPTTRSHGMTRPTMNSQLNSCLEKLVKLRIPADRDQWGESTYFRAPCKPLLILAVIDMAANGSLLENLIEPSFELAATYSRYWKIIAPHTPDNELAVTFLDLEHDGLWQMTRPSITASQPVDSMEQLRKSYPGAKMPTDIFPLLTMEHSRKKLRETITKTYFAAHTHAALLDVALINHAAAIYSQEILSGAPVPSIKTGRGEKINTQIALLGFNSAIVELYDHRCAICGIKLLTPEGHSATSAHHIIPRQISKDDHPTNGLALCKLCGWSFDNGLMGINEQYKVVVPTAVRLNGNLPGHTLIFKGRTISKPQQESFRPAPENLAWHGQNVLRK